MRTSRPGAAALTAAVAAVAILVSPGWADDQSQAGGPYTGLVVVVRGMDAHRSMTPRIVTPSGVVVYGQWAPGSVNPEFAITVGVAEYPASVDQAKRSGPRPLVIQAVGINGPAHSDIVVSDADAVRIIQADRAGHFLDRFAVSIVITK
jgi:hypothetical protein